MPHFIPALSRQGRLAAVSLLSASILTALTSSAAYAAQADQKNGLPTSKGYPAVVPWVPNYIWDCNHSTGVSYTATNGTDPHGYDYVEYPKCYFYPAGTPQLVLGAAVKKSADINNCTSAQASNIMKAFSATVTNEVQDMNGYSTQVEAGLQLGEALKLGINHAWQNSHTVSSGTAYTDTTTYNLSVNPYSIGYVQWRPYLAQVSGTVIADYWVATHGQWTWRGTYKTATPVLIPGTNEADGEWKVVLKPCP
ncbi:hypothetical protein ACIRU3_42850 [Streptomyces sp. NPDC101151]|uniref:hypothetical protein n=1 Tax=Streptomyces sp. NPDC101151 TaxID=3366115 RepID=UPI0037F7C192